MKNKEMHLDPRPLLKLILSRFFGRPKGFVSMLVKHIPSPVDGAALKVVIITTIMIIKIYDD